MPTALITGATAGIGAAFARRLAADGYDLILLARDAQRLRDAARSYENAETVVADLATEDGIRAGEVAAGRADLLVNNAGFGHKGRFLQVPIEDELTMLRVHCEAVLRLTYAAVLPRPTDPDRPPGSPRPTGDVINVASVAGFFSRGTYGASKAWVISFSQGVAQDVPGARVMALCPGFVHTEFHERAGMDMSRVPSAFWLNADGVVATAMKDFRRGAAISVPGAQYKTVVALGRLIPRNLSGRISARTGRRYGG